MGARLENSNYFIKMADNSYNGAAPTDSHYNSHHGVGKSSFYPSQKTLSFWLTED